MIELIHPGEEKFWVKSLKKKSTYVVGAGNVKLATINFAFVS